MIKILIIALSSIIFTNVTLDLDVVRKGFIKAVDDKNLCSEMIKDLKPLQTNNVCIAYLGGYQTIWAKHVFNPFTKLKTFNEGKRNIEKSIKNEPQNPELRLVRLSVQKNAPSFLGYTNDIQKDELFIKRHFNEFDNPILMKMASELLKK